MIVSAEPAFRTRHANPYNALLYDAIEAQGVRVREFDRAAMRTERPDIVHVHWPELMLLSSHRRWQSAARVVRFGAAIRAARARGTRFVWTVHNDGAHESAASGLQRGLERMLRRNLDAVLTLSAAGERAFRDRFGPDIPVFRTPHGHYRTAYPLTRSREDARAALGVPAGVTLLAAVGQVRPYKNLPALLDALAAVPDPSLRVAVAGRPDTESAAEPLRAAALRDSRVLLDLQLLDDERMALWLRAADLVVLPYRRILNSGAAMLALSADRPVVVPSIGAMPELAEAVGDDWVHTYDGEFTPAALAGALDWLRSRDRGESPDLAAFEWDQIARSTVEAYRQTLELPAR